MPYKMQWYIEGEILYHQYAGAPGVEEIHACLLEINSYMEQGKRPLVHVVVDVTQVTKAASLLELAQALKGYKPDARIGWTITVGEQDKMVKFTASIARQILHVRQRSYNTMQEALDFLRDIDSGLHWSAADDSIFVYASGDSKVS